MAKRYAEFEDFLVHGLPMKSIKGEARETIEAYLDYASSRIDDAIDPEVKLPLSVVPVSVKRDCCLIAAYELLRVRGFNPDGSDKLIIDEYKRLLDRLEDVGSKKNTIVVDRDRPPPPLRPSTTIPDSVYSQIADGKTQSGY